MVALLNDRDSRYEDCVLAWSDIGEPMMTTWPCLSEASHLLQREAGPKGVDLLWEFVESDSVTVTDLTADDRRSMRKLMRKYANFPMDLADASLVVLAERLSVFDVFTIDMHFHSYRPSGRHFTVIP